MNTHFPKTELRANRQRFRFSLRTMLFAVVPLALVSAGPGRWMFSYLDRQNAFAEIGQRGGSVQLAPNGDYAVKLGDADVARLRNLAGVSYLDLAGTKVTDADLAPFQNSQCLVFLDLSDTGITDAGLVHLKNLTRLRFLILLNTRVTDQGLSHLRGLKNLENLVLDETRVGAVGLESLKHCTRLRELTLWGTQVTDEDLVHLANLKSLDTVGLPERISDSAVNELKRSLPSATVFQRRVNLPFMARTKL